jgi:uncharacterized protein (TIGR02118 family)
MVKLVYCVRRRPDIEPEEFHRYWLRDHGRLVAELAAAIGAKKYVQSHTMGADIDELLRRSRGCLEPFDGITEVWWESVDGFSAGAQSPEGRAAAQRLLEDEARFIDLAASALFMTEEHVIFDHTG